ncbi:MAG: hypothetical protein AAF219_05160 [Myxococcota bacterium]
MSGKGKKKPYQKPRIRIVELRAEETLDQSCKFVSGGPGFSGGPCSVLAGCFAPGS